MPNLSEMPTRQKVTIGAFVVILLIIIWQIKGLFGGDGVPESTNKKTVATNGAPQAQQQMQQGPQPALLSRQQGPTSQREQQLIALQKETEAKYVAALNELQMLKISQQIAETNQAIMSAKLATVTSQLGILQLLTPKKAEVATTSDYSQALANPVASGTSVAQQAGAAAVNQAANMGSAAMTASQTQSAEANYTVISVTQLQDKWAAVLGLSGSLYHVTVGDVLPADQSTVVRIDKTGVLIEKNNNKKKLSLVPII